MMPRRGFTFVPEASITSRFMIFVAAIDLTSHSRAERERFLYIMNGEDELHQWGLWKFTDWSEFFHLKRRAGRRPAYLLRRFSFEFARGKLAGCGSVDVDLPPTSATARKHKRSKDPPHIRFLQSLSRPSFPRRAFQDVGMPYFVPRLGV